MYKNTLIILLSFLVGLLVWVNYGNLNNFFEGDPYMEKLEQINKPIEEVIEDIEVEIKVETEQEIKDFIVEVANEYGVDSDLALRIAECESQFRNVCNTGGCQYGIGIFQIVASTFYEAVNKKYSIGIYDFGILSNYSPLNVKDNIDIAIYMMSKNEYWRWNQSKSCWQY